VHITKSPIKDTGSKAFNIAGPVILYGTVVSSLFGLLYYVLIEIAYV